MSAPLDRSRKDLRVIIRQIIGLQNLTSVTNLLGHIIYKCVIFKLNILDLSIVLHFQLISFFVYLVFILFILLLVLFY